MKAGRAHGSRARQLVFTTAVLVAACALHAQRAPGLPELVGAYVHAFIDDMSNVVAQEEFVFHDAQQTTVRSDLLLVQYPGSQRNLLMFRDVSHVNGVPLSNREPLRSSLFSRAFFDARARASAINASSAAYVPIVLKPLYSIVYLQSEYQPRFRVKETKAGTPWSDQVTALTFEDNGRPTLLKSGRDANANVPARGTAWVDKQTGRVLKTVLQVRDGKSTTLTTTFGLDERLGVMVPKEMRTENPNGTATYSNFQRFDAEVTERFPLQETEEKQ